MRYLKFFTLILAIVLINCERDDICAVSTPTTPRLLIEFYDVIDQEDLKSVPRLTIYGDSPDISIPDEDDSSSAILVEPFESERIYNRNTNSAGLPLLIGTEGEQTTTRFIFEKDTNDRIDDDNSTQSNLDILEFTYTPEFVYVSRACGYKSIFNNLIITIDDEDEDQWISRIEIEETSIENENTVHVRIFH